MNLETKITIYKFTPQVFTLTRWGMGKNIRYTLTLTNNATPIKFTPNVGIWTNEDGTFTGL